MNTKNLTLIIILAAVLIIGGCGCSGYNGLVSQDEVVKNNHGTMYRAIINVVLT